MRLWQIVAKDKRNIYISRWAYAQSVGNFVAFYLFIDNFFWYSICFRCCCCYRCRCFSFIWYVINFHRAVKDRNRIIIFQNETLIRLNRKSLYCIFVFACVVKESVSRAHFNRHTHWGEILLNVLWNFQLSERRQKIYINWIEMKWNEMNSLKRECHKSIFIIRYNTRVRDISVDVRTPFSFSFSFLFFSSSVDFLYMYNFKWPLPFYSDIVRFASWQQKSDNNNRSKWQWHGT